MTVRTPRHGATTIEAVLISPLSGALSAQRGPAPDHSAVRNATFPRMNDGTIRGIALVTWSGRDAIGHTAAGEALTPSATTQGA